MQELVPLAIFGLGTPELIIIAVVLVLLFGAKRIPDLGKSVGQGIRNFKKGLKDAESEDEEDEDEDAKSLEAEEAAVIEQDTSKKKASASR